MIPRSFPGLYAWFSLVAATLASVTLGMVVTFHLADQAVKVERAARVQAQQDDGKQREAARLATCSLIEAQDDVYTTSPPSTPTGLKVAKAWHDLSIQYHCS